MGGKKIKSQNESIVIALASFASFCGQNQETSGKDDCRAAVNERAVLDNNCQGGHHSGEEMVVCSPDVVRRSLCHNLCPEGRVSEDGVWVH